ncbi:MAG: imidazolonepropionase [Deltaproteobacteria bacterium]|nr:imidazolonepropionase [Deltaproteobacteria bacterium]MBW1927961.1 imidazolonepropionase [Deltaproteobacteria bacterium]RLB20683.1 MAG: imidazolonepropionase [Deltaproteobacteria bacterium]
MKPGHPYGLLRDGAIGSSKGKIVWVGERRDLPQDFKSKVKEVFDAEGGLITPGLIDCHTHLVYAGCRAREFEMRLQGISYQEIARQGGGILSTVSATRSADEETLFRESVPRLASMMAEGVTTVEIKSGYGLDLDTEARILRVAQRLGNEYQVSVIPTFLGAHALPPEYAGKSDEYIDFVCKKVLPHIAKEGLARFVDVFCETIAFTKEQTERVFKAAKDHGLQIKLHAEQLSDQGGTQLAASYGALSVDHLEYLSKEGVKSLAKSGTVAVLLPGAAYFLREKKIPPIDLLRQFKIPIAVSTDCNPGSSPVVSILLVMNMACILFGLTPEEALRGVTINAAMALGMQEQIGTLERGKDADFVVWNVSEPAELVYHIGLNPCRHVVRHGMLIRSNEPYN